MHQVRLLALFPSLEQHAEHVWVNSAHLACVMRFLSCNTHLLEVMLCLTAYHNGMHAVALLELLMRPLNSACHFAVAVNSAWHSKLCNDAGVSRSDRTLSATAAVAMARRQISCSRYRHAMCYLLLCMQCLMLF